jgi:tetratricopeptide (TPR) repeat protein
VVVRGCCRLALGALVLLLAGCAGTSPQLASRATGLPPQAAVAEVPFHAQEANFCGPAAMAMALGWSGLSIRPENVVSETYTPGREGTLQHDLIGAARRAGRLAVPLANLDQLLTELAAGHPVLVLQNLGLDWYPQWHYAVAVGYDLAAGELVLHSGAEAGRRMSLSTFEATWQRAERWALVVLPPDRLPAGADEPTVLQAAAGLEQAGHPQAAAAAYGAALDRWPGSLAALIGLGNARYAVGQLLGAETAFRTAASLHPGAAPAWNNLAHVLAEQGELDEALAAAKRAVDLGGSQAATYRATFDEIAARSI